jgi:hypothetical protein
MLSKTAEIVQKSLSDLVAKSLPTMIRMMLSSSIAEKAECFTEMGELLNLGQF